MTTTRVLIVERPGPFRDALLHEVSQRDVEVHVRDDAMDALASIDRVTPHVVVVSDDPGPPGALGLCRVLQRKLRRARLYRIGEPSIGDQLDEHSVLLPRVGGAGAIVAAIFDATNDNSHHVAPRAWEGDVGSLELGPLLVAIESRWLTGRLVVTRPGTEREFVFVRGLPVHGRSTVLAERLGSVAIRRGMLTDTQVEQAVDFSHVCGVRIGAGFMDLGMLDATGLMRLLAAQLIEQLSAACNAGATHARFVLDQGVVGRYPLLRMSSMTALLHAAAVMPATDLASALDLLDAEAITAELQAPVERWLTDLKLAEAVPLTAGAISRVGELRERLREALPDESSERALHADTIALTLLRSGVFRMRELVNPAHKELRAGVRTLSPPSLVSAVVRCALSDFSCWPLSAIARARTPREQAIDVCLHGTRAPELAWALALRGPEADCDERFGEVYSLLLRLDQSGGLFAASDASAQVTLSDVRLRCHAQLKRVDALESENLGGLCRVHLLQTRERLERALSLLPVPEASGRPVPEPVASSVDPTSSTQGRADPASSVAQASPASPALERSADVLRSASSPAAQDEARMRDDPLADGPPAGAQPPVAHAVDESRQHPATTQAADALSVQDRALLEAAEPLLEQERWRDLRLLLAPDDANAVILPPVLALVYAIATKEDHSFAKHDEQTAPGYAAESIAITVVRQLFDLPDPSVLASTLVSRLLRRRSLDWKQKPPARVSALLVVSSLLLGGLVGFLLHPSLLGMFWK